MALRSTLAPIPRVAAFIAECNTLAATTQSTYRKLSSGAVKKPANATEYCLENVRKFDHDNYLSVVLVPRSARAAAVAIRAFNVELAQVADVTSEPLIARMRFQFWRDALRDVYKGTSPKQPVVLMLQRAVENHKLSKRWLTSLIDSREAQLDVKQFASIKAVEDYAENSNSVLYYLLLQSLGVQNVHADHAASHIGKAEGIVKLLRATPHLAARRKVLLPRDVMMQHNVSQEDIVRGKQDQKVKDVIFDIASVAHQHIEHARSLMGDVPCEARVALLPCVAAGHYLTQLQRHHFDVFSGVLQRRNSSLPFLLAWAKLRNRY